MSHSPRTSVRPSARPLVRTVAAASAGVALVAAAATWTPATAHDDSSAHHGSAHNGSAQHSRDGAGRQLAALKRSLSVYQDVTAAQADGFIPVSECTASPAGAMGVHYLNPARAAQAPDPDKPAILLYAPTGDGSMRLLGAEWFQADADQDVTTDGDRPTLFGQSFDGPMPGHDPMMPVHYDLHVWLFDSNPAGVFAAWNPTVDC